MRELKQSFLERLTGTKVIAADESEEDDPQGDFPLEDTSETITQEESSNSDDDSDEPGIAIDMYESDNELMIQCMIAGVTPENLQISITRDTVSVRGRRISPQGIPEEHYITRELYWGAFSRVINLPYEIDTDGAEAVEKYGLLIIRLPKLDTRKTAELKVKSI